MNTSDLNEWIIKFAQIYLTPNDKHASKILLRLHVIVLLDTGWAKK